MKSLRKLMLKKLILEHKELTQSKPAGVRMLAFLSAKENWAYVFGLSFVLLLVLSLPGLTFLQFIVLKEDTLKLIIESRITTIVTIISMTLAVTGLLLSNLAIKHNLTYELLFKRSNLYLIIYFALSAIAFLIAISMLRNTLDPEWFGRLVLASGYMCLIVIFGIGFLFRTIIEFTTPKVIEEHLKIAMFDEHKANICYDLLRTYSTDAFVEIMNEAKFEEISIMKLLMTDPKNKAEEMLVYDIRLKLLRKLISKINQPDGVTYIPLGINSHTKYHDSFLSIDDKTGLSGCLILKPSKDIGKATVYFKYFSDKLNEYSKEAKAEKVTEILDIYLEMYRLEYSKTS